MKEDKTVAVIGGRNNGKAYATIQNLTVALNEERNKYKKLGMQFNEMVAAHNALVDAHDGLLSFIKMQCGVLYTAITGDIQVDDPIKPISILTVQDAGNKDLMEYRQGLCVYVIAYEETGDPVKAFEAYQKYLGGM